MFIPQLKYVCKCCVVLVIAVILDVFLGWAVISTLSPRFTVLGKFGRMLFLPIETIAVELCVALVIIGMFGGKWIGGPPITGFILSVVYYMGWFFLPIISMHRPNFDFLTLLIFLGLPLVVVGGGLVYTKCSTSLKSGINLKGDTVVGGQKT